ncbi:MAG TPA: NAD(P)/FAD-dependent oxidoreductase [Candidatus Nitrosotalea sp.]|nr:NAD(P)/FAD-dependent oxidoreductase [Candidatus Nitrosotalea sp.]
MNRDVIVIGGGAAGLMCAIAAARRGRSVVALESAERLANKILISGGGRCNFTNTGVTAENYVTRGSPDFCKSALARFTPNDFIALVETHGITWHEKKLGQLFCDVSSRQIVKLLQAECNAAGVDILLNCQVREVSKSTGFTLETNRGLLSATSLVVATGGLSYPKLGATSFGYRLAEQFGLKIVPPRPGLVPLIFSADDLAAFGGLSGISLDARASVASSSVSFRENILFTHRGLSGPAILQISNYIRDGEPVHLDLLPDRSAARLLEEHRHTNRELHAVVGQALPQRLAEAWCRRFAQSRSLNKISNRELQSIATRLHNWEFRHAGDEGYAKAEVTLGGVDTDELSSRTMESRRVPGLYFVGEVVDVTGWLGGYNFQWAWASGHAAGQVV